MSENPPTLEQSWTYRREARRGKAAVPGLLLLFSGKEPHLIPIPIGQGEKVLGRDTMANLNLSDLRISRSHSEVSFEKSAWQIRDLGSRNGTVVDGEKLTSNLKTETSRVLRIGETLFGLLSDVRPFEGAVVEELGGAIIGPSLRGCWDDIERAARSGQLLHVTGESGTGKEFAARHFHDASARAKGPFVAVNCATIPANLAERLLFGAKRGAYSGADANTEGYMQTADQGTLFLDEIGELDPAVQAKLLRAIESKEVTPLGATRPVKVELNICSATHRDMRREVDDGRFRSDLFFRLGRPRVALPALRDRLEEIPWLIDAELRKQGRYVAHVSLVEACLLRRWSGNVRELVGEIAAAAQRARSAGRTRVEGSDLAPDAGLKTQGSAADPGDDAIADELRAQNGNVLGSAKSLGVRRGKIRRWIARNPELWKEILASVENKT